MPSTAAEAAFLYVRLPSPSLVRLEAAAAARGQTMQGLVGALVERFLAEDGEPAPGLGAVLAALRAAAPELRRRGVRALWVSGPAARGRAGPGSRIDLVAEFEPDARLSLVGLSSLRARLAELLGAPVGLSERGAPEPGAERDVVRAL